MYVFFLALASWYISFVPSQPSFAVGFYVGEFGLNAKKTMPILPLRIKTHQLCLRYQKKSVPENHIVKILAHMITYRDIMKTIPDSKSRTSFRYSLVVYALTYGISACARQYNTTRRTVQHWVRSYDAQIGVESLKNKSRVGQNHPQKIPEETRQRIIAFRQKTKNQLGARPIINLLGLKCSAKTVNKILKQNGMIKPRPTKWKKRWDMSKIRAQYKPFQKIQIDVKFMNDVPECYPAYCKGDIPKFMISARDYKSGWLFLAFSNKLDPIATGIYAQYLIHNLESAGVDLSEVSFQTDNGTEFVDRLRYHRTFFQDILSGQVEHIIIPPASPRYNSDVESFHGRVENELLKLEDFDSFPDFMSKAFLYNIYFNMFRKNRNRNNQTPADIICQDNKELKPTNFILPPILCDNFRKDYLSINDPVYFNGLPLNNMTTKTENCAAKSANYCIFMHHRKSLTRPF